MMMCLSLIYLTLRHTRLMSRREWSHTETWLVEQHGYGWPWIAAIRSTSSLGTSKTTTWAWNLENFLFDALAGVGILIVTALAFEWRLRKAMRSGQADATKS